MEHREPHPCGCPHCQEAGEHPDREVHRQMNLLLSRLDEQQRRWYVALESFRVGYGGDTFQSLITGLDEKTIHKGRQELELSLEGCPTDRIRQPGGGRPAKKGSRGSPRSLKRS